MPSSWRFCKDFEPTFRDLAARTGEMRKEKPVLAPYFLGRGDIHRGAHVWAQCFNIGPSHCETPVSTICTATEATTNPVIRIKGPST
jgi:hypothetical protein